MMFPKGCVPTHRHSGGREESHSADMQDEAESLPCNDIEPVIIPVS